MLSMKFFHLQSAEPEGAAESRKKEKPVPQLRHYESEQQKDI
jgi:hypothetical protein